MKFHKILFTLILSYFLTYKAYSEVNIQVKSIILQDHLSGEILYERDADEKIYPASMTKIMTAIIAFDLLKKGETSLDEMITISEKAWRLSQSGYSSMFIMLNDKVSVEDLLKGIIIVSGNDACVALAEGLSGTEEDFVALMNEKSFEIGLEDTNWSNIWRNHYKPIRIGHKLILMPPWINVEIGSSAIPVIIDPGQAFGTGAHPSTQLCLQAIEQHIIPGDSVLDIGCGSGILAIAALKLGAAMATGLDTDNDAIHAARQNAITNNVFDRFQLVQGTLATIKKHQLYRIVVVNILSRTIMQLINNNLANIVANNGLLILSGILAEQSAEIERELGDAGMILISKTNMTEATPTTCQWVALTYGKKITSRQV